MVTDALTALFTFHYESISITAVALIGCNCNNFIFHFEPNGYLQSASLPIKLNFHNFFIFFDYDMTNIR